MEDSMDGINKIDSGPSMYTRPEEEESMGGYRLDAVTVYVCVRLAMKLMFLYLYNI
jgi:hypothetical protein